MATEVNRIVMAVEETGTRVVSRSLDDVSNSAKKASINLGEMDKSLRMLRYSALAYVGIRLAGELREQMDSWIGFANNIRLSTKSLDEANAVQEELFNAAQRSRVAMEDSVRLYRRGAQAASVLGASQQDLINFTEGVGMALAIQGVGTKQASGALLQLGQLLGMARIRAQEFNSINENAPRILQAVTNHIQGTGGSINNLRMMLNQGKISNKQFFDAFMAEWPKLKAEFANVQPTIGQAFIVLDNAWGRFINQVNQATGFSRSFANGLIWLGKNLEDVGKIAAITGVMLLIAFGPSLYAALQKATLAMYAFMASLGPWGWLAIAIGAAVTALALYKDQIIIVKQGQISLGDYMKAFWQDVVSIVGKVWDYIKSFFSFFFKAWSDQLPELGSGWTGFFRLIAEGINDQIRAWMVWYAALEVLFKRAGMILQMSLLMALKPVPILGDLIPDEAIQKPAQLLELELGAAMAKVFSTNYVGDWAAKLQGYLDDLTARARKFAEERQKGEKPTVDLTVKPPLIPPPDNADKLSAAFRRLREQIDPVWAAQQHFAEGTVTLDRAFDRGWMSIQQYDLWFERLKEHYQDAMDPMGAVYRKLDEETEAYKFSHDIRVSMIRVMEIEKTLRKSNIILTDQQKKVLTEKIIAMEKEKRIQDEMQRLYEQFSGPQRKLMEGEQALIRLRKENKISADQMKQTMIDLRLEAGKGTWSDGMIKTLDVLSDKMTNWAARTGALFGDLVNSLSDGLANAAAKAIVFGESFKQALGDVSRQALAALIAGLIKIGIQMMLNFFLGETLATAAVAASVAQGSAIAVAYAPAAAAVSLATMGANSAPAMAGMEATAMTAGLLFLEEGGYTGNLDRKRIAGLVHGQEFVVNADATRRNRSALEAMNRGGSAGGPSLNVTVINQSSAQIDVTRVSPTEVRIIAREEAQAAVHRDAPAVVANAIANPNSQVSRSLSQHTDASRRRNA